MFGRPLRPLPYTYEIYSSKNVCTCRNIWTTLMEFSNNNNNNKYRTILTLNTLSIAQKFRKQISKSQLKKVHFDLFVVAINVAAVAATAAVTTAVAVAVANMLFIGILLFGV